MRISRERIVSNLMHFNCYFGVYNSRDQKVCYFTNQVCVCKENCLKFRKAKFYSNSSDYREGE